MTDLKDRISAATKDAMKARDKARVAVLRLVNADIKRVEVDERLELDDDGVLAVLNRMLKQRKDALGQYRDAGRDDLADQEDYEISVIAEFLPEPLGDAELEAIIDAAVAEAGAESMQDMGRVMALVKAQVAGRADMGLVSGKVKARLA
jgi:uncharacterized protein YqeY